MVKIKSITYFDVLKDIFRTNIHLISKIADLEFRKMITSDADFNDLPKNIIMKMTDWEFTEYVQNNLDTVIRYIAYYIMWFKNFHIKANGCNVQITSYAFNIFKEKCLFDLKDTQSCLLKSKIKSVAVINNKKSCVNKVFNLIDMDNTYPALTFKYEGDNIEIFNNGIQVYSIIPLTQDFDRFYSMLKAEKNTRLIKDICLWQFNEKIKSSNYSISYKANMLYNNLKMLNEDAVFNEIVCYYKDDKIKAYAEYSKYMAASKDSSFIEFLSEFKIYAVAVNEYYIYKGMLEQYVNYEKAKATCCRIANY